MATTTSTTPTTLVKNFYQILTTSQPSDSQVALQAQRVSDGVTTLGEILRGIYQSSSYTASPAAPLAKLFFFLFDRAPDYSTYKLAFDAMRNGMSLNQVAEVGLGLTGYSLSNDGLSSNSLFVTKLYQKITGESSAPQSIVDQYANLLTTGQVTRGELVAAVVQGDLYASANAKTQTALLYLAAAQREVSSTELDVNANTTLGGQINLALKAGGISPTGGNPYFIRSSSMLGLQGTLTLEGELGSDLVFNLKEEKYTLGGNSSFKVLYSSDGGSSSSMAEFSPSLAKNVTLLDARGASGKGKIQFIGKDGQNNTFYANASDTSAKGGDQNDLLVGNSGKDTLTASSGIDTLIGGNGDDTFSFAASVAYLNGSSKTNIKDLGNGKDSLDFSVLLNKTSTTSSNTSSASSSAILATSTDAISLNNGDVKLVENNGVWTEGSGSAAKARGATAAEVAALFGAGKVFANPTVTGKYVVLTADIRNGADVWLINNDTDVAKITDSTTGASEVYLVGHIDGSWNTLLAGLQPISIF